MKKLATLTLLLSVPALLATPASARTSDKDRARISRAAPEDRGDVAECLRKKKKGGKTGTIAGAAAGAGVGLIAGGNLGETALAAGGGALAGNLIGKGSGTNRYCDDLLRRNP